ncbi:MAG: UvrD-helicase domain-containing protein [Spirochaetales bacterium]|nr:UvrD-helicase domain-containing protein [Spirochaetales bacterium]
MNIRFDKEQQKAIRSAMNTVVMAGAGAGKTSVLAERYLWLLKNKKARVDEILTLTFTKKAAAEMYEKIYRRLKQERDPLIQEQLKDFSRAQISTLDSFCAQIVRNAGELFGLAADFSYEAAELSQALSEVSLDFLLRRWQEPGLAVLLRRHGFERVLFEFLQPLAESYFNLAREFDFTEMHAAQYAELRQRLEIQTKALSDSAAKIAALEEDGKKSIANARAAVAELKNLEDLVARREYEQVLGLLKGLVIRKPGSGSSQTIEDLKSLIDEFRSAKQVLILVLESLAQAEELRDIFSLLSEFQTLVNTRKRSLGLVSFNDVAEMAVEALRRNEGLRGYYKTKYRFIMIDEFQDNNLLQKQLLYLLAEKNTLSLDRIPEAADLEQDKLLFVGDEKQSIYAFRGADVSVFKALHAELCRYGGSALLLHNNYRSEPGLIAFFNLLFRCVLQSAQEDYEARFQELSSSKDANRVVPEVHFLYKTYNANPDSESEYGNDESEAFRVAEFLARAVQQKKFPVCDGETVRPAGFNDFVILMRSTSNQIIYERMLRLFSIPYTTEGVRSLFLEAPINDMYNLLQLAVHPEDRVAYAALLRSPLVNLSDDALVTVMLAEELPFAAAELEPAETAKYEAGRERYEQIKAKADRVPLTELVFDIWYGFGYRYHILKNPQFHTFLEYYDYFFRLAERADARGWRLSRFLDMVRKNLGKYEKQEDLEILKEYEQGVQLMTIHKAKGLEFPIVVLANTGNKGKGEDKSALYYISPRFGLSVNLGTDNYFYAISREENEKREIAELKRLLYVALTRAESHLIISGCHNRQNRTTPNAHLNMLLQGLGMYDSAGTESVGGRGVGSHPEAQGGAFTFKKHIINDLTGHEYFRIVSRPAAADPDTLKDVYHSLPEQKREFKQIEYSVTELNLLYKNLMADRAAAVKPIDLPDLPIDARLSDEKAAAALGILSHYLIHTRIKTGAAVQDMAQEIPLAYMEAIPEELRAETAAAAQKLAQNFFSSGYGGLLAQAGSVETEFPFLYKWERGADCYFIHGIIDLFFETEDKAYVLDFKTDKLLNPQEYALQLALYKKACAELTDKKIECFLFALRSGEAVYIEHEVEWEELFGGL